MVRILRGTMGHTYRVITVPGEGGWAEWPGRHLTPWQLYYSIIQLYRMAKYLEPPARVTADGSATMLPE
jgi:hypothetical protein